MGVEGSPEKKIISVLLRKSPFNTLRNAEALRMSLGLTLREDRVQVFFLEDSVYLLLKTAPERIKTAAIDRHIETLLEVEGRLIAERESLEERRIGELVVPAEIRSRREIAEMLAQSDIVITY